ncbi:MAG: inositol phosphate phosphatase SopB [Endozoicomonas sp.]
MLPPLSATEIKLACESVTDDKRQVLARKPSGEIEAAGSKGWGLYWTVAGAPEGVETMVSGYNQYLKRHQYLESMKIGTPLAEKKVKPIDDTGECLISRLEEDLPLLEQSPAYRLHEAEVEIEKCFMGCSTEQVSHKELKALIQELTDSATDFFPGDTDKLSDYLEELQAKLTPYKDGPSADAFRELQTQLATLPLTHHFETKQTENVERKKVKPLAARIVTAAVEIFEGARETIQNFLRTTITTLSELAGGHTGKKQDLAAVKEVFSGFHQDAGTPLETWSVTTEPVDEGDDFATPQSSLNESTEPSPNNISPFEDIDPMQALNWQARQLADDGLSEENPDTSSIDELKNEMPSLKELEDEVPLVKQSLHPQMSSLQPLNSLQVSAVEEEPGILRSVMTSLRAPEPYSLATSLSSFPSLYPTRDAVDELNSFIDEEQFLDCLDEEEAAEVQQALQEEDFLNGLQQEMNQPNEPGSPASLDEFASLPPMSLVPLTSLSQPGSISAVVEHKGVGEWRFANPLGPEEQTRAAKMWNECITEAYGGEGIRSLPEFEKRRLHTSFYHLCLNSEIPPTKSQLMEALKQHRSAIEELFPGTSEEVKKQPGLAKQPIMNGLANCVESLARSLNLDVASIQAMTKTARVMEQCAQALASSPYDDDGGAAARKEQLIELKRQLDTCRGPFDQIPGHESNNPNMVELHMPMEQDLGALHKQLDEQIAVMDQLIENDFSQHRNLATGKQRMLEGALQTIKAERDQVTKALPLATKKKVMKALQAKLNGLALLEQNYNEQLSALSVAPAGNQLEPDIVQKLHEFKAHLGEQMKAARIGSGAIKKGLQTALKTSAWLPVNKHYVMRHDGKLHHYDVENIPAGAMHWSTEAGLHPLGADGHADKTDVFKMAHGGRSSMSPEAEDHAVNAWVVKMKADDKKVMHKVRTAVPVPFPLIGTASDKFVQAITVRRLRETIALMLLESMGNTEAFRDAVDNPDKSIEFNAIHTSLLSPDKVREYLNTAADFLPDGFKLKKLVKKNLENEAAMLGYLQEAIKDLSEGHTAVEFHDEHGNNHTVKVKYDGVLFACPVNKMGQKKFKGVVPFNVWEDADPINMAAAKKMFGGMEVTEKLTGWVGAYLASPNSPDKKVLVEKLSRQIQHILANKLHHSDQNMALLLPSLLNTLGQYAADGYHDFCKSGKDRTGLENQHAIMKRAQIHATGDTDVPPVDAPQSQDERFSNQSALACTGQSEIVQQNFAEAGLKIDLGGKSTGQPLYDRVHY